MEPTDDGILCGQLINIYDEYRTALLSQKYYAHQLAKYKRVNLLFEIALAAGSSTTIGAWAIWQAPAGQCVWKIIGGATAVIALLKPILQLSSSIERYSKLYEAYCNIWFDLKLIAARIRSNHGLNREVSDRFEAAQQRLREVVPHEEPQPSARLRRRFADQVNTEIPPDSLWMPAKRKGGVDAESAAKG